MKTVLVVSTAVSVLLLGWMVYEITEIQANSPSVDLVCWLMADDDCIHSTKKGN